jgi:hypothetical protein
MTRHRAGEDRREDRAEGALPLGRPITSWAVGDDSPRPGYRASCGKPLPVHELPANPRGPEAAVCAATSLSTAWLPERSRGVNDPHPAARHPWPPRPRRGRSRPSLAAITFRTIWPNAWPAHGPSYPLPADNVFLALIALRRPDLHQGLQYGYATLWFTTPFFGASLLGALFAIAMYRHAPRLTFRELPRYVPPEERPAPSLVLGEAHHETRAGRAPDPQWLTIPQRGLYTGVMVLGSVGTGKTSACMYPYVDQLVRWRSHDADHKLGGLVMEVKGDFCRQVQAMLRACGREAD